MLILKKKKHKNNYFSVSLNKDTIMDKFETFAAIKE